MVGDSRLFYLLFFICFAYTFFPFGAHLKLKYKVFYKIRILCLRVEIEILYDVFRNFLVNIFLIFCCNIDFYFCSIVRLSNSFVKEEVIAIETMYQFNN